MATRIEDRDGNIVLELEKITDRMHEYISGLYDDNKCDIRVIETNNEPSSITCTKIKDREFNGTSTHYFRCKLNMYTTLFGMITKHNRRHRE